MFKRSLILGQSITFAPIRTPRKRTPFDLGELVDASVGPELRDGDILVVSSKFIAVSEGRVVDLRSVVPSADANEVSKRLNISPELCELVIRESDDVIGGVSGFMLALKEGLLTPNAGIDKSNIEHGKVVLYPRNPLESATSLGRRDEVPPRGRDRRRGLRQQADADEEGDDRGRPRGCGHVGTGRPPGQAGPFRERPEGHEPGDS